jgi:hypothetical protein
VPVNYSSLNELVSIPGRWRIPTQFWLPPYASLCKLPLCNDSALSWPPILMGYDFTSGLQITVSSIHRQKHLGICLPTVGSQTWVRWGWECFRPSGESNPHPWRWIKSAGDQHIKCNERRTRPCHRAYCIRGATRFHRNLCQARIEPGPGPHPLPTALLRE